MATYDYDMVVIGSGPGGQRAATQAAKLGKKVALAEYKACVGGVCINLGTIPSKTLREAALHLSGYRERNIYGASYTVKERITMSDLLHRCDHVVRAEIDVIQHQLKRNGIEVIPARAAFVDPHTIRMKSAEGQGSRNVTADKIVIASGTVTARDSHIAFDGQRIFTSDDILSLNELPKTLAVVGAGVIGIEYATIFAILGVRVTVIDKRPQLLSFVDQEIVDSLVYQMRQNRATLRLGEDVAAIEPFTENGQPRVRVILKSQKHIVADKALYSIGRVGATGWLDLDAAGVKADDRGRIKVDAHYRTTAENVYAVGDVIGFPSLASTSMEQGRIAACHAFAKAAKSCPEFFPYGIYAVPEISTVGKNEEELTVAGVPYEVGKARYKEISRGMILGDSSGLLKLLFHRETRKLLGVAIIGEGASELIHIGQAVLAFGGSIDYFIDTVFNYPTLAECYKTAAFDGINRLG